MARTDFEPLTWEEAEQNRQETLQSALVPQPSAEIQFPGVFPEIAVLLAEAPSSRPAGRASTLRPETPAERCERLRNEIKRGKDYLEQAERELAESRALLEDWPGYEQICGKNPLAHLTEAVLLNARIAHFLAAWVKRREAELESLLTRTGRV